MPYSVVFSIPSFLEVHMGQSKVLAFAPLYSRC